MASETEKPTGVDNERTETMGAFGFVLMLPLVIGVLVLISIYLTQPVLQPAIGG